MRKMNITDKLQLEQPILEIAGHEFVVDNSKDTMLAFDEKMRELPEKTPGIEICVMTVEHFLGEDAAKTIAEMKLTAKGYDKVAIAILALAGEEDYETVEARFHREDEADSPAVV